MRRTLLDNDFVQMWFYPSTKIIHHEFRKFVWGEAFQGALNRGLEVLQQEGACKWLSDDRRSGALSKSDTEWAMTDWFPRVLAAGWKSWAVVLPANVLGEMNMNRFIAQYSKHGLMARPFSQPTLAMTWLENANGELPAPVAAKKVVASR